MIILEILVISAAVVAIMSGGNVIDIILKSGQERGHYTRTEKGLLAGAALGTSVVIALTLLTISLLE